MSQKIRGVIGAISEPIVMNRDLIQKTPIVKVVLTLRTVDNQLLYIDLVGKKIRYLKEEGIKVFSAVEVEYIFKGTETKSKKYNNIFAVKVKQLKI